MAAAVKPLSTAYIPPSARLAASFCFCSFFAHLFLLWFLRAGSEGLLLFDEGQLDVAGRGHVGVDSTVGSVGSTPHLRGTVNLDVINDQMVGVQTLVLGVALRVLQHVQKEPH